MGWKQYVNVITIDKYIIYSIPLAAKRFYGILKNGWLKSYFWVMRIIAFLEPIIQYREFPKRHAYRCGACNQQHAAHDKACCFGSLQNIILAIDSVLRKLGNAAARLLGTVNDVVSLIRNVALKALHIFVVDGVLRKPRNAAAHLLRPVNGAVSRACNAILEAIHLFTPINLFGCCNYILCYHRFQANIQ